MENSGPVGCEIKSEWIKAAVSNVKTRKKSKASGETTAGMVLCGDPHRHRHNSSVILTTGCRSNGGPYPQNITNIRSTTSTHCSPPWSSSMSLQVRPPRPPTLKSL